MPRSHLVIPDTQVKPGVPTDHLRWAGLYLLDRRPDVVVHLGDHWDMPSLSSYDRGKQAMEGRRYEDDVAAGNDAMRLLTAPLEQYNRGRRRRGQDEYTPDLRLLRGNHEWRIARAVQDNAQLDGARHGLSLEHLEAPGWQVHDFLEPVFIDGIGYSHYWANPMSGRPYGGMMETRLKTVGHSFTMGHQQTLQVGCRYVQGVGGPRQLRGLVAGAFYLHHEDYLGPQGNAHWRGLILKHEVREGAYDLMEVSVDYLCRKYEGVGVDEFMLETYGHTL